MIKKNSRKSPTYLLRLIAFLPITIYREVMDWRNVSRSRSRMSWGDNNRSSSRPPSTHNNNNRDFLDFSNEPTAHPLLLNPGDEAAFDPSNFNFIPMTPSLNARENTSIPGYTADPIPIPGSTHDRTESEPFSTTSGASFQNGINFPTQLPQLQNQHNFEQALSGYSSSAFLASASLPAFGAHGKLAEGFGGPNMPMKVEPRPFPKHVRKTSFDHTVSRYGISSAGLGGRHQVNGIPLSPGSSLVRLPSKLVTDIPSLTLLACSLGQTSC
jgi:GATA-binding protein, other eukaryote